MVACHPQFNAHEFEQTLGDSEGQGSLASMGSQRETRLRDSTTPTIAEWPCGFPYFLQFMLEFCNKELMI